MRVLVLASNPGLWAELVCSLRQRGHAVDQVCSEREAFAALRSTPFEMLVVDLGLSMAKQEKMRKLARFKT